MLSRLLLTLLGIISPSHQEEAEALHRAEIEKKKPISLPEDPELGEIPKLAHYQQLTMQIMAKDAQLIDQKLSQALLNQQIQEEELQNTRQDYTDWLRQRPDLVNSRIALTRAAILAVIIFILEYAINIPSALDFNNIEIYHLNESPPIILIFALIQNSLFVLLTALIAHFAVKT